MGIEATGHTRWFERMLTEFGHELWIGDAAQIRASMVRKQKTDARDAAHVLELLSRERFPRIWRAGGPGNLGCLAFFANERAAAGPAYAP